MTVGPAHGQSITLRCELFYKYSKQLKITYASLYTNANPYNNVRITMISCRTESNRKTLPLRITKNILNLLQIDCNVSLDHLTYSTLVTVTFSEYLNVFATCSTGKPVEKTNLLQHLQ